MVMNCGGNPAWLPILHALRTLQALRETKAFLSPPSLEAAEIAEKEKIYFRGGMEGGL